VPNLTGGYSKMLPNHHITKPVYIGDNTVTKVCSGQNYK
jgi:hypothetical protein